MRRVSWVGVGALVMSGFAVWACSNDSLTWTDNVAPNADATSERDSCGALDACCAAGEAGNVQCGVTAHCAEAFQDELNYGFCADYTYPGFHVWGGLAPPSETYPAGSAYDADTEEDAGGGDAGDDEDAESDAP